ncbi:MAG: hypothetical protein M5R41_15520 [Bacteroidia bacterium]|nr:hypothetical protein [Bacteroidia bacterium]
MKLHTTTILLCIIGVLLLLPDQSSAIPAFARKYNISCSTCHSVAPKLKEYGEDFAGNAFNLPDAPPPARTYVDAGDDMLLLHRFFPIAIRFDGFLQLADRDHGKLDFQSPYGVKLLSGGPISEHVGYYMYFYMNERGEVTGLEDAYVHFNNIFNSNLDIMVGQFQVCDPLFKRELRLTLEDYEVYKMRPSASHATLTYDRGIMMTYGLDFGLDLSAQALNGSGIGHAENKIFDVDNGKAFAFRASQSLGPVRIGGFLYTADEALPTGNINGETVTNAVTIFGPDLTIGNDHLELNAQYLMRTDDAIPALALSGLTTMKTEMNGIMVELLYLPDANKSTWNLAALYNRIEQKDGAVLYHTATASAGYLLARNLRLVGEVTYDIELEKPKLSVGFVSAF